MKVTLEALLPKLMIDLSMVTIIASQGKSDLERSIPRKLRGWRDPDARFLVLRDNDRGDCRERKRRLNELASSAGNPAPLKIRIVCQELEAWFLADTLALVSAGYLAPGKSPAFSRQNPDEISHPVHEMEKLIKGYGKISGATTIAPHLDIENTCSASFRNTIQAIRDLTAP
ncbi:MAG: DUF4276 family protein [Rhodobacteraceae bacterium]|nr:DUF4276 family protein [Paracoccaceae bacterium]